MRSADINAVLASIARRQHQLLRVSDAHEAGIDRKSLDRRVSSGMLEQVDRNMFRFASSLPSWHQRALAAVWAHGPDALLSHRAAALLHRLDGIESAPFEILTTRGGRRRRRSNTWVHETKDLPPVDRMVKDSIPCTAPARLVLDLAAVVPPFRTDQAFEDVLRRRLCTTEQVADRFVQLARGGRPGTAVMRELLAKRIGREVPTRTEFERRVRDLAAEAGLVTPAAQIKVRIDETEVYLDLGWPDRLLGVECDGLFDHGSSIQLPWDDDRQNQLQLRGWLILRFTWQTLTRTPETVVQQLREGFSLRPSGRASGCG